MFFPQKNSFKIFIFVLFFAGIFCKAGPIFAEEIAVVASSTPTLNDPQTPFVLAVEKDYPPFLYVENGAVKGITYDFFSLIAKKLNKKLLVTEPMQLKDMLLSVQEHKANVLIDITKTEERDKFLEFSDPYVEAQAVIIGRNFEEGIDASNFSNSDVTIAVGRGYGVISFLKSEYPDATLVEFDSDRDVVRAVSLGATSIGVLDFPSLAYILGVEPLGNIKILQTIDFKYLLSIAVLEEQKDILPLINSAIAQITPNERQNIIAKWTPAIQSTENTILTESFFKFFVVLVIFSLSILFWAVVLKKKIKQATKKLLEANQLLNDIAKERTTDFNNLKKEEQKKAEDLEKIKKAILNILEDVQEERNKFATVSSRLTLATNSAKIGVWEWDVLKNIINWDDQMYKLYGIKREDFPNPINAWNAEVHPDDRKMRSNRLSMALKGEKDYDLSFRIVWPNGEIHFIKAYAMVERNKDGEPIRMVGANFDVTKEKEVDQAKSEFVSLASHQLRTPLSAINWYAEMLMDGDAGKLNEEQEKYVKEIYIGNQRMVDLVNSLLNVSRLDLGTFMIEPTMVDVIEMSKGVVGEMKPKIIEKHLSVTESYEPDIPKFFADGKLLRIVLQNLYSNAVKYTPDSGKVDLGISIIKKTASIGGRRIPKDTMCFMVKDSGMGIPKKQQDKIFSKLFRADNAKVSETEGTGLGLYIVKSIIDQSGGQVWFVSGEGKGTTFYITFPISGMKKKEGTKELT